MEIKKFIDQVTSKNIETKYNAGRVWQCENDFLVSCETLGAQETFSIGQPVFDTDGNLMGYLSITLLNNLNYFCQDEYVSRIPKECWKICLPTRYCEHGKQIRTFWQNKERIMSQ